MNFSASSILPVNQYKVGLANFFIMDRDTFSDGARDTIGCGARDENLGMNLFFCTLEVLSLAPCAFGDLFLWYMR